MRRSLIFGFVSYLSRISKEADSETRTECNLFGKFSITGRRVGRVIREGQAANTGYIIKTANTEANGNLI